MKAKNENQMRVTDKGMTVKNKIGLTKTREVWDKPVSKVFYEKLRVKVSNIVKSLGYVRGYTDEIMKSLDRYMANGEVPMRYYCEEYFMAIFFTLRVEIDEAIARSAAARQRAAERRARKAAEKEREENKNTMASDRKEIGSTAHCMKPIYPEHGEDSGEVTKAAIGKTRSGKPRNVPLVYTSSMTGR